MQIFLCVTVVVYDGIGVISESFAVSSQCNCLCLDVPAAPTELEVTNCKRDSMMVEWKPPRKDGGSEITGYVIDIKERNSVLWKTLAKTHSTGDFFDNENTQLSCNYYVVVMHSF